MTNVPVWALIVAAIIIGGVLAGIANMHSDPYSDYNDAVKKAVYNARVTEICNKAGLVTRTNGAGIAGCYNLSYKP